MTAREQELGQIQSAVERLREVATAQEWATALSNLIALASAAFASFARDCSKSVAIGERQRENSRNANAVRSTKLRRLRNERDIALAAEYLKARTVNSQRPEANQITDVAVKVAVVRDFNRQPNIKKITSKYGAECIGRGLILFQADPRLEQRYWRRKLLADDRGTSATVHARLGS